VLNAETQAELTKLRVALVTVSTEAVAVRIAGSHRPLLGGGEGDTLGVWSALVEARREIYERLATHTWDTSHRPIDGIAAEIADWTRGSAAKKEAL
jgi:shikimate kinase